MTPFSAIKGGVFEARFQDAVTEIIAPYRTFPELRQPSGRFIVRWNQDAGVKVIPSPDEGWRVLAVQEVRWALLEILGDKWAPRVFA